VAHAVPTTDACGFSGCLTSSHTVLFTELVYSGSVNSSSGLPINNYILPQLTDYFPNGNPLRSCTTASLVVYTPDAQPALAKREMLDQVVINTFAGAPTLTPQITFSAFANRVDSSPPAVSSTSDNSDETSAEGTSIPATSSTAASTTPPSSSQQGTQTRSSVPGSPSSSAIASSNTVSAQDSTPGNAQTSSGASDSPSSGATQASNTEIVSSITASAQSSTSGSASALGTMTLTGTLAGTAGNSSSPQPSTWNFVCSSEGCRLASSSETTASNSSASSTSAGGASQTTSQGSSVRVGVSYGIVSIVLAAISLAMA
jgi:hypothetical protein